MDVLAQRYSDCATKEAERLTLGLKNISAGDQILPILCMGYIFPDHLLNSVDFQDETERSVDALNQNPNRMT